MNHNSIADRLQGVTPLGPVGPRASGLADVMGQFLSAPVRGLDHMVNTSPKHTISSIIHHPSGMG